MSSEETDFFQDPNDGIADPSIYVGDGNTNGNYDSEDKLISPENELTEYFMTFHTDQLIDAFTSYKFSFSITEHPILMKILNETKLEFRNKLRDGIAFAIMFLRYDKNDPEIGCNIKELRNRISLDIDFPTNVRMAELSASLYEGKLVTFEANISDWQKMKAITYMSIYKCSYCGLECALKYTNKKMEEPCTSCGKKTLQYMVPLLSDDCRRIMLREIVSEYTKTSQPFRITGDAYGKTAHEIKLSSNVIVSGIFTSVPLNPESGKMNRQFIPTIQIISVKPKSEIIEMPDMALIGKLKDLEEKGQLIKSVIDGFAYNIFEKRMEKKAVICSLLGSEWIGGNNPPMIHILFVGDPDTYKSTIMKYCVKVSDYSIIADATAVSGNGIKAIAIKQDDGTYAIRAGLMPTYNKGVVFFDEFGDFKDDSIYEELKTVMIDARVRKHVGGEDFDAMAETGVLASMNPTFGVWDDNKTLPENLSVLGKALITRFDAIFRFPISFVNEHEDEIDALMTTCDAYGKPEGLLTDKEIKLFLNYARTIHPKITVEALNRRNEYFKKIRERKKDNSVFETRAKNSIIKFAVALAKWHMCNEVRVEHVDEALELYSASLATCHMNFAEGEYLTESKVMKQNEDGRITAIRKSYDALKSDDGYAFMDEIKNMAMTYNVFKDGYEFDTTMKKLRADSKFVETNNKVKFYWTI